MSTNPLLAKTGDITADLRPHQRRVRNKMRDQSGLVMAHDMGSGKTLTSISAAEDVRKNDPGARISALVPASLRDNFRKEIQKHTNGGLTGGAPELMSHTKRTLEGPDDEKADLQIVDEAHNARSVGSKLKDALRKSPAENRLLMTGTPVYNHPFEVAPLVNMAAGEHKLPETKAQFENKFVEEEDVYPEGLSGLWYRMTGGTPGTRKKLDPTDQLTGALSEYVDYHKPGRSDENYPDVSTETVKTKMSDRQRDLYRYMLNDLPGHLQKKMEKDLPPNKQEQSKLMTFLNGPRQVATSIAGFDESVSELEAGEDSPKIQRVANEVERDPKKKRLIYSNYLKSGLNPLEAVLDDRDVSYGTYTGQTGSSKREENVRRFNDPEDPMNTLLVSSAGGEGLDLKGVREAHVLEPHWNEEKIRQVVARADRYKSHAHLPEEEQNLKIKRYEAEVPEDTLSNRLRDWLGKEQVTTDSAETYIRNRAEEKKQLSDQMIELMDEATEGLNKESSIYRAVAPGITKTALGEDQMQRIEDAVRGELPPDTQTNLKSYLGDYYLRRSRFIANSGSRSDSKGIYDVEPQPNSGSQDDVSTKAFREFDWRDLGRSIRLDGAGMRLPGGDTIYKGFYGQGALEEMLSEADGSETRWGSPHHEVAASYTSEPMRVNQKFPDEKLKSNYPYEWTKQPDRPGYLAEIDASKVETKPSSPHTAVDPFESPEKQQEAIQKSMQGEGYRQGEDWGTNANYERTFRASADEFEDALRNVRPVTPEGLEAPVDYQKMQEGLATDTRMQDLKETVESVNENPTLNQAQDFAGDTFLSRQEVMADNPNLSPDVSFSSLDETAKGLREAGDMFRKVSSRQGLSQLGQRKYSGIRPTITMAKRAASEELSFDPIGDGVMDMDFDLSPGIAGQEFNFDMDLPEPDIPEPPDIEIPDGDRASAGDMPEPEDADVDMPESDLPKPEISRPKQQVM